MRSIGGSASRRRSASRVDSPPTSAERSRPPTPRAAPTPTPAATSRHMQLLAAGAGRGDDADRGPGPAPRVGEAEPDPADHRGAAVRAHHEQPALGGRPLEGDLLLERDVVAEDHDVAAGVEGVHRLDRRVTRRAPTPARARPPDAAERAAACVRGGYLAPRCGTAAGRPPAQRGVDGGERLGQRSSSSSRSATTMSFGEQAGTSKPIPASTSTLSGVAIATWAASTPARRRRRGSPGAARPSRRRRRADLDVDDHVVSCPRAGPSVPRLRARHGRQLTSKDCKASCAPSTRPSPEVSPTAEQEGQRLLDHVGVLVATPLEHAPELRHALAAGRAGQQRRRQRGGPLAGAERHGAAQVGEGGVPAGDRGGQPPASTSSPSGVRPGPSPSRSATLSGSAAPRRGQRVVGQVVAGGVEAVTDQLVEVAAAPPGGLRRQHRHGRVDDVRDEHLEVLEGDDAVADDRPRRRPRARGRAAAGCGPRRAPGRRARRGRRGRRPRGRGRPRGRRRAARRPCGQGRRPGRGPRWTPSRPPVPARGRTGRSPDAP